MANRGTSKPIKTRRGSAWTGKDFKNDEEKRLKKSGVDFITSGRGTTRISVKKTKTSKKKSYKGKISTSRGTNTRDQ